MVMMCFVHMLKLAYKFHIRFAIWDHMLACHEVLWIVASGTVQYVIGWRAVKLLQKVSSVSSIDINPITKHAKPSLFPPDYFIQNYISINILVIHVTMVTTLVYDRPILFQPRMPRPPPPPSQSLPVFRQTHGYTQRPGVARGRGVGRTKRGKPGKPSDLVSFDFSRQDVVQANSK